MDPQHRIGAWISTGALEELITQISERSKDIKENAKNMFGVISIARCKGVVVSDLTWEKLMECSSRQDDKDIYTSAADLIRRELTTQDYAAQNLVDKYPFVTKETVSSEETSTAESVP